MQGKKQVMLNRCIWRRGSLTLHRNLWKKPISEAWESMKLSIKGPSKTLKVFGVKWLRSILTGSRNGMDRWRSTVLRMISIFDILPGGS